MALTEQQIQDLADNQFSFRGAAAGAVFVDHLPCDTGIYLGEDPRDIDAALAHLPECSNPNGPADTFHGQRPWPKGTPGQEAKKEAWLARIAAHPQTTDEDYDAAVSLLVDPTMPIDELSAARLESLGFVVVNPDGTCAAVDAW
ncbi:hypothetical protein [Mycolicibacterium vulneris]|uniref:hypothetical protein n=1 Tax=Mycolicibacterium vulneris TaxID=547163 RepID=UPI0013FE1462|nr:hypothetical protein [Mycolicibacterium vulneris]